MLGTNPSGHLFITPSGQTFAVATGPLTPGTRILAFEALKQDGAAVGSDLEQCTMSFQSHGPLRRHGHAAWPGPAGGELYPSMAFDGDGRTEQLERAGHRRHRCI